jgi:hypothetical protein
MNTAELFEELLSQIEQEMSISSQLFTKNIMSKIPVNQQEFATHITTLSEVHEFIKLGKNKWEELNPTVTQEELVVQKESVIFEESIVLEKPIIQEEPKMEKPFRESIQTTDNNSISGKRTKTFPIRFDRDGTVEILSYLYPDKIMSFEEIAKAAQKENNLGIVNRLSPNFRGNFKKKMLHYELVEYLGYASFQLTPNGRLLIEEYFDDKSN